MKNNLNNENEFIQRKQTKWLKINFKSTFKNFHGPFYSYFKKLTLQENFGPDLISIWVPFSDGCEAMWQQKEGRSEG